MYGIIILLGSYILVLAAGSMVYAGLGFHNRRTQDSTWHDMAIDVVLLGLVVVFIFSGIAALYLKGNPDRHGDDWGLMIGLLPAGACIPLALASPIIAIFGWKGMDRIHKIRAFIPMLMYFAFILGNGLTSR